MKLPGTFESPQKVVAIVAIDCMSFSLLKGVSTRAKTQRAITLITSHATRRGRNIVGFLRIPKCIRKKDEVKDPKIRIAQ